MSEYHLVQPPCTEFVTRLDAILPTLATKAEIAETRADIRKMTAKVRVRTLATMLTIVATMLFAIFWFNQNLKVPAPTVLATQSAAIIIIAPAPTNSK